MIRSFGDKRTEALFRDEFVPQFQGIARPAKRKLEAVNAASRLEDLMVPPQPKELLLHSYQRSMAGGLQMGRWRAS